MSKQTQIELANGQVGEAYSQSLNTSLSPPVVWNFISGNRPPGLTLNSSGVLSGVPSKEGYFTFEVQVSNSTERTSQTVSVSISPSISQMDTQGTPKSIFNEWWFWALGIVVILLLLISIFFVVRHY